MDRSTILLFSLKADTLDSLRELAQVCRVGELIATLAVDVTDVGVHSDAFHVVLCFVHVATIQDQGPISTDSGRFGDRHTNSC